MPTRDTVLYVTLAKGSNTGEIRLQLHTLISYVLLIIIVNAWVDVLSNCKQHAIRMACMIYLLLSITHSDQKGKMSPRIMVQYVNEGVDVSLLYTPWQCQEH